MVARREHRFFVDEELHIGQRLGLSQPQSRQITGVFRLRRADHISLFDGSGFEYEARILEPRKNQVVVEVEGRHAGRPDPRPAIELAMALIKSDRFDLVVQKATELGVAAIIPLSTSRAVVSLTAGRGAQKRERWQRIAVEAAEQSGRSRLPLIAEPRSFDDVIDEAREVATIVFWEGERRLPLSAALQDRADRVRLIVGPEGGFDEREIERVTRAGALIASLGPLVLRAETAALAAIAGVQAIAASIDTEFAWGNDVGASSE